MSARAIAVGDVFQDADIRVERYLQVVCIHGGAAWCVTIGGEARHSTVGLAALANEKRYRFTGYNEEIKEVRR